MSLKDNPRFVSLKDKGRNYLDLQTNETISKRIADKRNRMGLSNETASKLNKITNPELAVSRPARGRTSILKKSAAEREFIAQARIEDAKRKAEIEAQAKEDAKLARALLKQANKTVAFKKFRDGILKPGSKGARLSFNTYEEYLVLAAGVKRSRNTLAYSLGMIGYHEHTAQEYGITVLTMKSAQDKPYTEKAFYEAFDEERQERSYFIFQHYFMHIAFKKEHFEKVFADHKAKVKSGKVVLRKKKRATKSKRKTRK